MIPRYLAMGAFLLLTLANCTTNVESNPARTATEELLISTAAERAAAKLTLQIPPHANVFVDNGNFEGTDSKYAIASIRSSLLKQGIALVDDKKNADVIVETRAGASSIDRKTFMIGIPQFNIPVPFASSPIPFPEIALYGTEERKAIAKFAATGYYVKKGTLVADKDPQYGYSHITKKTVLIFISWTDSDYLPDSEKNNDGEKKDKAHMEYNQSGYSTTPSAPAAASAASTPAAATTTPSLIPAL